MSRLFSLLLVAFVAALVITPAVALRGDDVADLASEASNEEVDFLAAEDAADEQAESGMSLQAEEAEEEAEAAPHQSATPSSSAPAAVAPAEAVTELKKQVKALAATTKDAFALDAFAAEHDEHANAASASTEAKSEAQLENVKIESSSKQTPTGLVVSHSAKVASPTYNPAKHRGQRALRFYCDFKHCHPHGAACFKSCTKLREGQPRIDCHAHCNAVRRKCFNCCAKAKLPQKTNNADDEKTRAERAIAQCNGYTEFCLEYNPPPNVTPDKNWVRSACISIQKK